MYVCICIHIFIHAYTNIHARSHTHMSTYTHAYTRTHKHIRTYAQPCSYNISAWDGSQGVLGAEPENPHAFADKVLGLLLDQQLWAKVDTVDHSLQT